MIPRKAVFNGMVAAQTALITIFVLTVELITPETNYWVYTLIAVPTIQSITMFLFIKRHSKQKIINFSKAISFLTLTGLVLIDMYLILNGLYIFGVYFVIITILFTKLIQLGGLWITDESTAIKVSRYK